MIAQVVAADVVQGAPRLDLELWMGQQRAIPQAFARVQVAHNNRCRSGWRNLDLLCRPMNQLSRSFLQRPSLASTVVLQRG
eukprot:9003959-Pyramimonas_sp.AAC.1